MGRLQKLFILAALVLVQALLQGCAVPVTVYKDGPSVSEQAPVQVETNSEAYGRSLKRLGYPVWLGRSGQGEPNVMMVIGRYFRYSDWNFSYLGVNPGGDNGEWMTQRLNNAMLGKEDITLIEIAIAGLSNGQVTRATKRFSGPADHFNWVELFRGRVPRDGRGYLMEVDVAINYLDNPGYKNSRQYFVHLPVLYIGYPGRYDDPVFGSVDSAPFLNFDYNKGGRPTGLVFNTSKTERWKSAEFYSASALTLGGRAHRQFHYMNPGFLEKNGMFEGDHSATLEREARYGVYKDEEEIEKLNQALETIYPWAEVLSRECYKTNSGARGISNTIDSLSGKSGKAARQVHARAIVRWPRHYEEIEKTIALSRAAVLEATKLIKGRAAAGLPIDALAGSIERLYKNTSEIAKWIAESEPNCAGARRSVASLAGSSAPSGSDRGFMSALGAAMSKELASSYQPGYRRSGNYSGGDNAVADTMKQFHVDLKRNYEAAKELQKQQQPAKTASYQARLSELKSRQGSATASKPTGQTYAASSGSATSASMSSSRGAMTASSSATSSGCLAGITERHTLPVFTVEGRAFDAQVELDKKIRDYTAAKCAPRSASGGVPGTKREVLEERKPGSVKQAYIRLTTSSSATFGCGCDGPRRSTPGSGVAR